MLKEIQNLRTSILLPCLVLLCASLLFAQVETARITGTVADATGAVIPGATVTFIHTATNAEAEAETGATGQYVSPPLRIGQYRIEVSADGFKRAVRTGVVLQVQQTATLDFSMELGAVTESIDVTADAPLLATTEATQGQVIDNQRIVDMPLNGRDYTQLALLSAGTVQPIGGRFGGFSAAGQRTTHNNFLLDGVDNNNLQLAAQGRRGETVWPSIDAIQEFKVSTNAYSAEFGRALGGVVNATIKSGTNEVHGTVFEFIRNEALEAKNFFDDPDADKPPFKRNQYGFSLGGPIVKNRVFLFGDYEGTRIRESNTVTTTIPTPAQRAGDFSAAGLNTIFDPDTYVAATKLRQPFPGNVIPEGRFDRVSRQAKDWYPNPSNNNLTLNFLNNPPARENVHTWDIRGDYIASSGDNLYYRFSSHRNFLPERPTLPPPAFGGGDAATPFTHTGNNMALVWNHIFTPNVITATRLGWNRIFTDREPPIDYNANAQLGLAGVEQTLAGAPQFTITSVANLGIGANTPNLVDSQTRQLVTDTTWTAGRHSVKFGANLMWLQSYIANPKEALGVFNFNGAFTRDSKTTKQGEPFADFLLGISRQTTVALPVHSNLRAPYYQFYLQDEWRVSRKLTLNMGLRYELNNQWVEKQDRLSNFDIELPVPELVLAREGSRFSRSLLHTDTNNFGPRFGFAYRAFDRTVFRGGYGIFYGNYEGTGGGRFLLGNPPHTIAVIITTNNINPAFLLQDGVPEGSLDPKNVKNLRTTFFEKSPSWPMAQHWNFNIQHEVFKDVLWEVGYYGAKSQYLPARWDGNYATPGPGNVNTRRRFKSVVYPGTDVVVSPLTQVDAHNYFGNSLFHSLQTKVEKRFSGGFSVLGSYTFSRTIGDVSGFSGSRSAANSDIQDPTNLRAERSLDNQHRKHRGVLSYICELPFGEGRRWGSGWSRLSDSILGGWALSGILSANSGEPMGLSVAGDPANTGSLNRPNVVGDPVLSSDERSLQRWFNTDAFVPNDPYTFGNAGRNILIGPGAVNLDFAVFKRFIITERVKLQFRFEAFNATNTPHFGNPNLQVGNRNLGIISGAGRPRNLQFGLKLIF